MAGFLIAVSAAACGWLLKAASTAREDAENLRGIAGACAAGDEAAEASFTAQAAERESDALSSLVWAAGCAYISISCALGAWSGAAGASTW